MTHLFFGRIGFFCAERGRNGDEDEDGGMKPYEDQRRLEIGNVSVLVAVASRREEDEEEERILVVNVVSVTFDTDTGVEVEMEVKVSLAVTPADDDVNGRNEEMRVEVTPILSVVVGTPVEEESNCDKLASVLLKFEGHGIVSVLKLWTHILIVVVGSGEAVVVEVSETEGHGMVSKVMPSRHTGFVVMSGGGISSDVDGVEKEVVQLGDMIVPVPTSSEFVVEERIPAGDCVEMAAVLEADVVSVVLLVKLEVLSTGFDEDVSRAGETSVSRTKQLVPAQAWYTQSNTVDGVSNAEPLTKLMIAVVQAEVIKLAVTIVALGGIVVAVIVRGAVRPFVNVTSVGVSVLLANTVGSVALVAFTNDALPDDVEFSNVEFDLDE